MKNVLEWANREIIDQDVSMEDAEAKIDSDEN
jgi:hypothetical protein